jgi:hypothetical protein
VSRVTSPSRDRVTRLEGCAVEHDRAERVEGCAERGQGGEGCAVEHDHAERGEGCAERVPCTDLWPGYSLHGFLVNRLDA